MVEVYIVKPEGLEFSHSSAVSIGDNSTDVRCMIFYCHIVHISPLNYAGRRREYSGVHMFRKKNVGVVSLCNRNSSE
jgi:hypothetical protein